MILLKSRNSPIILSQWGHRNTAARQALIQSIYLIRRKSTLKILWNNRRQKSHKYIQIKCKFNRGCLKIWISHATEDSKCRIRKVLIRNYQICWCQWLGNSYLIWIKLVRQTSRVSHELATFLWCSKRVTWWINVNKLILIRIILIVHLIHWH